MNKINKVWLLLPAALLAAALLWLAGGRQAERQVVPLKQSTVKDSYDVLVVGGDPEGVAAAVAAARSGQKTLLVDTRPVLGGLMTRGWLNSLDMNYGPDKEILNKGIFQEFFAGVEGDSFDVITAANVLHRLVNREANLDVLPGARAVFPIVDGVPRPLRRPGQSAAAPELAADEVLPLAARQPAVAGRPAGAQPALNGVQVVLADRSVKNILAGRLIDATQDADLAAAAGVPFTYGQEDLGNPHKVMAVTLVFKLEGISNANWVRLMAHLNSRRLQAPPDSAERHSGANWHSAWGFDNIMKDYQPALSQVGMRGLNLGRQRDGSVLVNALQVYGIDGLRREDRRQAVALARQELPRIVEYIKEHVPGLHNARLAATAPELYVRETRHIQALYRLTVDDVLENRDFPDRIAFGSYPIDIQATDPHFRGNVVGVPVRYAVPFRCLVPRGADNLLVVGRSAGFDSLAHGSARVIPVGMATGQAAGVAAALSLQADVSFARLAQDAGLVKQLQERLMAQGVALQAKPLPPPPETRHWAYEGLKFMRRYGLAAGGYSNNYRLDEDMPETQFINGLHWVARLAGAPVQQPPLLYAEGNELTLPDVAYMLACYTGHRFNKAEAYDYLTAQGFWDPQIIKRVQENRGVVTVGAGYMLLRDFARWLDREGTAGR
ncbi:FAD-dependent oxidoreductase [Desulforamulus hydrothermalis]|uniref:Glucose-inhibited division protein A n=1 Tax=Desulforamulus hydrothermalis Lam5 = DSM 18033 TaxID=1121428 RepID=K8DY65_9FIRM|nr:FAD-dependent oxidoreductase [Desulforamulus hydrothermalis]CCO07625.1 Glucose-inhibited division protein A [Desulforamulus hydrothermalis Lam5 = DSM 18033]SHH19630.1 FAD dependent oxidoreductase [Desulforamulus hydrothermalis Lam5 = DSM 18033]